MAIMSIDNGTYPNAIPTKPAITNLISLTIALPAAYPSFNKSIDLLPITIDTNDTHAVEIALMIINK